MEFDEAKEKIVAGLTKKSKSKSKFYFNDLATRGFNSRILARSLK